MVRWNGCTSYVGMSEWERHNSGFTPSGGEWNQRTHASEAEINELRVIRLRATARPGRLIAISRADEFAFPKSIEQIV